jgi:hypothetical protein
MQAPPEQLLSFPQARANFYLAAEYGLDAELPWFDSKPVPLPQLIIDTLLPLARTGLRDLGIDAAECEHWLGIIEQRARTKRTGSAWQCAWVARFGPDMAALTEAYLAHQADGRPVHEWALD